MKFDVVILGAGPCGLCAAWELANNGFKVAVIEKDSQVGGLCKSIQFKDHLFDLGGHRFISGNKGLVNRVHNLLKDDLLVRDRKSTILLNGRSFQYPLRLQDIFMNMPLLFGISSFSDYIIANIQNYNKRYTADISLEEWVNSKFGNKIYNTFFGPYSEKFWGIKPDNISSDWAANRIPLINLKNIKNHLFKSNERPGFATKYYYPVRGIGQIFERIRDIIRLKGGRIFCNAYIKGLNQKNGLINSISFTDAKNQDINISGTSFISTIPLTSLGNLLFQGDNIHYKGLANKLSFRSLRFMNILVNRPSITDNTWIYVPDKRYIMTRIQEPRNRSPLSAPSGKTSIMLEIPCSYNDEVWNMEEAVLAKRVLNDLKSLGFHISAYVTDYFSTYEEHAYPIYKKGYLKYKTKLLELLNNYRNLISCGRGGEFNYIFMDQAMISGINYARQLVNGSITDNRQSSKAAFLDETLTESLAVFKE